MRSHATSAVRFVLAIGLVALIPSLSACKYLPWGNTPEKKQSCLDDPSSIKSKKFGLSMELEGRVKATLLATTYLDKLAKKVDEDATKACGSITAGLGGKKPTGTTPGNGKQAEAACKAAADRISMMREKVANALTVESEPLRCSLPADGYSRCARECDPNVGNDNSTVTCEEGTAQGKCSGKCEGSCFSSFGDCNGTCYARCTGECEEGFSGTCGGKCDGTCDGESITKKNCKGKCEGECSSDASGTCAGLCKGECGGSCMMEMGEKGGECDGTCSGSCSEDMTRVRCGSVVFPAEMGVECLAKCESEFIGKLSCEPATIKAEVYGEVDAKTSAKLQKVIPDHLEPLLKIQEGMKTPIETALERLETAINGVVEELADDKSAKKKVGACMKTASAHLAKTTASFERSLAGTAAAIEAAKQ